MFKKRDFDKLKTIKLWNKVRNQSLIDIKGSERRFHNQHWSIKVEERFSHRGEIFLLVLGGTLTEL